MTIFPNGVTELEDKERENQEKISIFQRRIMKLTKTLDDVR